MAGKGKLREEIIAVLREAETRIAQANLQQCIDRAELLLVSDIGLGGVFGRH